MMKFKDEGVDGNVKGVAFLFKKNKIDTVRGHGPHRRARQGRGEGGRRQDARRWRRKAIVIATGSDVARLPGIDIDEKRIVSSTGALVLDKVPERLLVVGAGVIGLELGSVWRRLGSEVIVVEFLDRILPGMDNEVCRQFQRILEKQGIKFKLVVEGHRRRRQRARRSRPASSRRPAARPRPSRPTSCWSRSAACPSPTGSASKAAGVQDGQQGPRDRRRALRHQRARHLRHRRRDRRADARAQGGGRGRGGGGDPRRPGRARELRRDPERGLHVSGDRLGRQERGGAEGRPASPTTSASFRSPPTAAPRSITRPTAS